MLYIMFKLFVCLSALLSVALGMESSKLMEGFPTGFLADCPGSEKKAIISKRHLKYLTWTVAGYGNALSARKRKYTYFQSRELMKDPNIDIKKKTFVFIGGFMDSANFPFDYILGKEYKDIGYNVLVIDLNRFTTFEYPVACRYMRPVGVHAAEFLANLTKLGLDPKKLELVGLSLGAHAAGFIGKNYHRITGTKISRITGLDPAGPCFRNLGPEHRLDETDADFVDMIATNIDGMGMATPVGHVNFYVNGGEYQPGDVFWMTCATLCSHVRSFTIWIAAMRYPNKFVGMKCDSVQQARRNKCYGRTPFETNIMGLNTNKSSTGIFYLATDNVFPYYLGGKGLKKEYEFWTSHLGGLNKDDVIKTK